MLILTVVIWLSFLSIEWKFILTSGTVTYLFCSWDIYVVEEQPRKYEHSMKNI